ncbi:MAG TPA: tRNA pseudouridine(55) synthase TruB [Bdellovibrionota bacterium]|jgi:tRNA pseudouridine55 synthase|nr:tRNA pseudouridine(55) synthase TruB [Bdellovibrionota bacterium]
MAHDGALLVDKPAGLSSFDVVAKLKSAYRKGFGIQRSRDLPKFGHGGTLDPFATGLLVVAVGEGTKLARYFLGATKGYEFTVQFGQASASGDSTDPVIQTSEHLPVSLEEISRATAAMAAQKPYPMVPPMHSAKKRDGRRLYELAREGIEIEREPVDVQLHEFQVSRLESPAAHGSVICSAGTYVRVLAQDLARNLGTVGMLSALRRTRSGSFQLADALPLDLLIERLSSGVAPETLSSWVPLDHLLTGMASVEATADQAVALIQGRQHVLPVIAKKAQLPSPDGDAQLAIYTDQRRLVAVARRKALEGWALERVFANRS